MKLSKAKDYLDERTPPYVIKADGLAAGKGVIITSDRAEAETTIDDILVGHRFGDAGAQVVNRAIHGGNRGKLLRGYRWRRI